MIEENQINNRVHFKITNYLWSKNINSLNKISLNFGRCVLRCNYTIFKKRPEQIEKQWEEFQNVFTSMKEELPMALNRFENVNQSIPIEAKTEQKCNKLRICADSCCCNNFDTNKALKAQVEDLHRQIENLQEKSQSFHVLWLETKLTFQDKENNKYLNEYNKRCADIFEIHSFKKKLIGKYLRMICQLEHKQFKEIKREFEIKKFFFFFIFVETKTYKSKKSGYQFHFTYDLTTNKNVILNSQKFL
ncbi:hypothetical protein RFI_04331 [Reticulomyxa filosa]|uniref:Uncharacterized protein n=1 Tax=Reticulomyxa filosa TaxID=46433 RepID=X6P3W2_RETFI|nr:hypothetical protein RFI_04331 [Reticulomyxa filosa]|eukprot:ETO32784.1 hypothetical protein RFI_04331 [Reticulomyxa filosa]